jgi:hypothetical protein
MRELTTDMRVSVDGFADGPGGGQGFTGSNGPNLTRLVQQVLDEPQEIVLCRVAHQEMAPYSPWAVRPVAERIDSHPWLVFTRTLTGPLTWNNARPAGRGPAEVITIRKREPGPGHRG